MSSQNEQATQHTPLDAVNTALAYLEQIAMVFNKMNNAPVGKTTDKVYEQFTLTSWDKDDPYKAIDVRCFQKGRWCPEPKQQNITKGVHGLLLIIKAFRFFKDAPGMEPELAWLS